MSSRTIPEVFMPHTVAYINMYTVFLKQFQPQSYFPLGDFDISADEASIPQTQSLTYMWGSML